MRQILVLCDGARATRELLSADWEKQVTLSHRGASANVNLSIESPSSKLLTSMADRSADLVKIAAYAYASDQAVTRGGETDIYGDSWRREFTLCLPVADHAFWSQDAAVERLQSTLQFASDDTWRFRFTPTETAANQLTFDLNPNETLGKPDSAYLFSGGLDSLCAVMEAASRGAKPLLIGHSPAFHIAARQRGLLGPLRERLALWHFPYLSVAIHRRTKKDPGDNTQRTRSFLYAAIGAGIAHRLGLTDVNIPDNGVVSLNLPINEQLLGAKASKSTHPRFLRMFTELSLLVFGRELRLTNPLWARTRAEVLAVVKTLGAEDLLEATNSCSHPRNLPKLQPHCGVCSQCIDRRFATLASGLEDHDPGERYRLDIFRQELPAGDPRTMALSYVRFGQKVAELSGEEMFREYPQLAECIEPSQAHVGQRETAEALTGMIQRHGQTVVRVLKEQIERSSEELASDRLPEGSLLRLVNAPATGEFQTGRERELGTVQQRVDISVDEFSHSDDYRSVTLRGVVFTLPPAAARIIEVLHAAALAGKPDLSWPQVTTQVPTTARSMFAVFRTVPEWKMLVATPRRGLYRLNLDVPLRRTA